MKRILLSAALLAGLFNPTSAQELTASFQNITVSGNTFSFDLMMAAGTSYSAATSINGGSASIRFNITGLTQPTGAAQTSVVASEFYPSYIASGLASVPGAPPAGSAEFGVQITPGGADPFLTITTPIKICRITVTSPAAISPTAVMTMRPSTAGANSTAGGASGYSYSGGADGIITAQSTVALSIELAYFNAAKSGSVANLTWATAQETGNNGFDVEQGTDGKSFHKIGFVNAKAAQGFSTTTTEYAYDDKNPAKGRNYYRLKQISNDGMITYSAIASVDFDHAATALVVYPNPFAHKMTVTGLVAGQEIRLIDLTGRVLVTKKASTDREVIHTNDINTGAYILTITDNNRLIMSTKVLKY